MVKKLCMAAIFCLNVLPAASYAQEMEVRQVNASAWPVVKVLVELPGGIEQASAYQIKILNPEVAVNASGVQELEAAPAPASTLLVIETGGRFGKERLQAAKAALGLYAEMFAQQESIALLSCDSKARLLSDFSQDAKAIQAALEQIEYSGEESDAAQALLNGLQLLEDRPGEKTLILLTESIDDADAAKRKNLLREARDRNIQVLSLDITPLREHGDQVSSLELWDLGAGAMVSQRISSSTSQLNSAMGQMLLEKRGGESQYVEVTFDFGDSLLVNPASALFKASILASDGSGRQQAAPMVLDVSDAVEPYPGASVCLIGQAQPLSPSLTAMKN